MKVIVTIGTVLLAVIFQLAFSLYFAAQLRDERDGTLAHNLNDDTWHAWGLVMRIVCFIIAIYCAETRPTWRDYLLALSFSLPAYDIFINLIALDQGVFYSGSTSKLDKLVGFWKWPCYGALILTALTLRIYENFRPAATRR